MTELGGSQITSLMEVLPGIAQVLRSPVADAIVNLVRAACRVRDFELADAAELLHYAVRRNLMTAEESERVLAEARESVQRRTDRIAEREKPKSTVRARQHGRPKGRVGRKPKSVRRPSGKGGRPRKKH